MEAAPGPLLFALERMLEGDPIQLVSMFEENADLGGARNNLPNLLWALEVMAWDPNYLLRVSRILARMAALDRGGHSGNQPIASLRDIFMPWDPGTNAPLASRIAVLDTITEEVPAIAWQLLVQLMPKGYDTKTPTQRPRFREAGASQRKTLTYGDVAETYDAVTDRAFALLGDKPERWLATLDSFPSLSPERRGQFADLLREHALRTSGEDRIALRRAIGGIADRHRQFREADWSLPEAELIRLEEIGRSIQSDDPIDQVRALFDEWDPMASDDYAEAERQISQRRIVAVARLATDLGITAVLDVARKVRIPGYVAAAAVGGIEDDAVLVELLDRSLRDPELEDFAISLASALRFSRGVAFDKAFIAIADSRGWNSVQTAVLLLGWPEVSGTWRLVTSLGPEAELEFWHRRAPRPMQGTAEELVTLVRHYLSGGRADAALDAILGRENDLDWPTIANLLEARVTEINEGGASGGMDAYRIEVLFKKLRQRSDVPRIDLARWEYAFFLLSDIATRISSYMK